MGDGTKPNPGTIAKRTLIRFVPFEVISLYTGQDANNKSTLWHDRWTSTRVVRMAQQFETQANNNPPQIVPSQTPAVRNNGTRSLLKVGVVLLGVITFVSGGALILVLFNSIRFGIRLTGNFWEDIFPILLSIAITGLGLFGIIKFTQVLRRKL